MQHGEPALLFRSRAYFYVVRTGAACVRARTLAKWVHTYSHTYVWRRRAHIYVSTFRFFFPTICGQQSWPWQSRSAPSVFSPHKTGFKRKWKSIFQSCKLTSPGLQDPSFIFYSSIYLPGRLFPLFLFFLFVSFRCYLITVDHLQRQRRAARTHPWKEANASAALRASTGSSGSTEYQTCWVPVEPSLHFFSVLDSLQPTLSQFFLWLWKSVIIILNPAPASPDRSLALPPWSFLSGHFNLASSPLPYAICQSVGTLQRDDWSNAAAVLYARSLLAPSLTTSTDSSVQSLPALLWC